MKVAYLILAHRNPRLIKKTVEVLAGDDASFFIHIDAKFPLKPFDSIRGPDVYLVEPRRPVYWGEFSQTEAIFLLLRQALAAPQRHDYFVLMSGSDFPLRSGRYVASFLEANRGGEFITLFKLPAPGMPLSRINTLRFPSTQPVRRFVFRALAKVGLAQRDYRMHLGKLEPYSGHTWWVLSRAACEYLIEFLERHPAVVKFFANTHASDETLIHTILGNSPFQTRIRRHLVFEDWHSPAAHPEMINARHLEYFESQNEVAPRDLHGPGELLFARKFSDDDFQLVERVAALIDQKENLAQGNPR
jgi:hypothetical protein